MTSTCQDGNCCHDKPIRYCKHNIPWGNECTSCLIDKSFLIEDK